MLIEFDGRKWRWPNNDAKLIQVIGQVDDLMHAINLLPQNMRRTAVQAGGAIGIWPYRMSKYFDYVVTFEPHKDNFKHLELNLDGVNNIKTINMGLSNKLGLCETKLPKSEYNNVGCYYTMPTKVRSKKSIQMTTIDKQSAKFKGPVDLIQLDVEGRELEVLKGALQTIKLHLPVIMIEEKHLPQDYQTGHIVGAAEEFLIKQLNYQVVRRIHRDVILQHTSRL